MITDIMNKGLRQLADWCRRENLKVNASKRVVIPFTRKRKGLGAFQNVLINDDHVAISGMVKYLGVTLGSKLT